MRRSHSTLITLVASATMLVPALVVTGGGPASAAEPPPYTVKALNFKVKIGPANNQTCNIVGDLYVPKNASAGNRMPAVLSTNGFGGSKADQAGFSKALASRGYVALSYSGLGFGGSSCEITLDDPAYDGKAASQLIDYLGGKTGIAYTDKEHKKPVARLDKVKLDPGTPNDPRVGMMGISYGGEVQYAAASVTPKLDAIVPIITWNDLSYSLGPNNTDQFPLSGQEFPGVSTRTPGSVKTNWALGFSALGLTGDVSNQQPDNPLRTQCPNFRQEVCRALARGAATGALAPDDVDFLRDASVASYQDKVKIPTLILQGQADTLFNLNEAVATYEALQAQGTEVKMSWVNYGHSGAPAEGEIDFDAPNPTTQLVTRRIFNWFEHHLQKKEVSTGPEFSYFRDWVDYTGIATPAYAASGSYPVGTTSTYHLSSSPESALSGGTLVTDRNKVTSGNAIFTAPAGPASMGEELDVISTFFDKPEQTEPVNEAPGTFAQYDTDSLSDSVDVVGSPKVQLQVQAPTAQETQSQDIGKLVLFLKVLDVAADGKATVVRNLAAPVRIPDVGKAFTVAMPAFVHRFDKGHKIRLVVAGASPNYRGNNASVPVTIATGESVAPTATGQPLQSITLPTVDVTKQEQYVLGPDVPVSKVSTQDPGSGNGPVPGNGNGGGAGGADGPASPADNANGNSNDNTAGGTNGTATPRDAAQSGPTVTDVSSSSEPMPDTGGPPVGLLGAGLLLVVLGAHQLARRRRKGLS